MSKKHYITIAIVAVLVVINALRILQSTPTSPLPIASKMITIDSLINMSDESLNALKQKELIAMITSTAKEYNINRNVFLGLTWHESAGFKYANKKIKDSNGRYSHGLFMIQLETAKQYDKEANEYKLLRPTYNARLAAIIFNSNLKKYGSVEYALAAHNAGTITNGVIKNAKFVTAVETAIGEVEVLFNN